MVTNEEATNWLRDWEDCITILNKGDQTLLLRRWEAETKDEDMARHLNVLSCVTHVQLGRLRGER